MSRQWWDDPDEQFELVSGDLDHPDMAQFIVIGGRAAVRLSAVLQAQRLEPGFGPQPEGTRGLDQFIGEADMLGRGHGSALHPRLCRSVCWHRERRAS